MTRPTDWDFSKISGKGEASASPDTARGEMPAFAIHIEKRTVPGQALPWADVEFERISKSPRRAAEPAPPVMVRRRFPRLRRAKPNLPGVRRAWPKLPAVRLPRFAMPHLAMPQIAMPQMSLPRIKVPSVMLPTVRMPRVTLPVMPQISLPRIPALHMTMPRLPRPAPMRRPAIFRHAAIDWHAPLRRVASGIADLRAPAGRGLRAAAFAVRVAVVAAVWVSAELVYFVRLGYAHARLAMSRLADEIGRWSADRFSGVDLRPLARQAAIVAVFIAAGYGAAVIIGPALKNGGTRLAALPSGLPNDAASSDQAASIVRETRAVVASLGAAVPLPMPRIAHLPTQARKKTALRTVSFTGAQSEQPWVARRLMPASQSNGQSLYGPNLVSEIQIRLLRLGYSAGPPTGALNARTRRAISLFQRDAAIPVTGAADMRLVRRLRDAEGRNLRFAGR